MEESNCVFCKEKPYFAGLLQHGKTITEFSSIFQQGVLIQTYAKRNFLH